MILSLQHFRVVSRALAVAVALPVACAIAGPAEAETRGAVQAACFVPQSLQARPDERTPVKFAHAQALAEPRWAASSAATMNIPRGAIRRVDLPPGRKLVALTFDLCETWGEIAGYDGAIVDFLRTAKVKATYFGGGKWMANHGERTQQLMSDDLFVVGTHGWAHRNMRGLTGLDMLRELTAPTVIYRQQRQALAETQCAATHPSALQSIPQQPALYRFPFGACNAAALDAVADAGLLAIQWDVSTGDPAPSQSATAIVSETLRHVRPGSIILAHANGRGFHTAEALPRLIAGLRAAGYQFVTVPELLAAGKPVITDTCYDEKPGDTDKYDTFFAPRARFPAGVAGSLR